ncbi:hypothetical protein PPTG_21204 [Phytophthora nicotianae INRA-310]|uniref:Uncharacterized protein n=2 Tax=Phytophthora nicotianae TaxID=4792 RepID=W2R5M4_PHYN3|nr:hypothetical protein PPTG_21204 [Phytophthora nicotianae INRA-310]ETN20019.1 hypothetical protein PPTG_21204 [Phytophthora nicotianae INRA-310]ETO70375.1 hypothetical protein F444_13135 [Phytophthora nicotianae P1976]
MQLLDVMFPPPLLATGRYERLPVRQSVSFGFQGQLLLIAD